MHLETLVAGDPGPVALTPAPPDTPAAIFFTSGSTGPAKGVTHTLETLGWMTASAAAVFELTADDRFLPASSMSHIGSFLWALTSFSVGTRVIVARTFDAGEVLRLLRGAPPDGDGDDPRGLWFYGRKKQIIVHDGSNISPAEVEGALADHPAVALVGVVGIHDEVHGENVRAYVTVKDGVARPTAQELVEHARATIGYKAPEEIVFVDEMPLNPTGKLDRVSLKRMAEDHLHPHLHRDRPEQ